MSLAPSTDLVLEVARAADPGRAAAVVEKLNALSSGGAATSPQDFAAALNAVAPATTPAPTLPASHAVPRAITPASREEKARTQLESVVLSQFVQEMLPKDTQSVYGQGYAGDMWRSMLAQRVADQMAASGRLGIASRLFATHPVAQSHDQLSPDRGRGLVNAAQTSANALSLGAGAEVTNGSVLFSGAKRS